MNLLTNIIVWVYGLFTQHKEYIIINTTIEYALDNQKNYEIDDPFWEEESHSWDGHMDYYLTDVTKRNYHHTRVPENVKKAVVRIKYMYNNRIYKYMTTNLDHPWPPPSYGFSFNIPYVSAWLLDTNDKPVLDILTKMKRYAGPRGNFHNEVVDVKDMLYYDEGTLQMEYPKIKMVNAIGQHKTVSTLYDTTATLRLF